MGRSSGVFPSLPRFEGTKGSLSRSPRNVSQSSTECRRLGKSHGGGWEFLGPGANLWTEPREQQTFIRRPKGNFRSENDGETAEKHKPESCSFSQGGAVSARSGPALPGRAGSFSLLWISGSVSRLKAHLHQTNHWSCERHYPSLRDW